MTNPPSRRILLLGGGRWGKVHASNCVRLLTSHDEVLWVSRHKSAELKSYAEGLMASETPAIAIFETLDEALKQSPTAAIIVTLPETHANLAAECLKQGLDVFVEKPLAFSGAEANSLLAESAKGDRLLGVGMHLLSASYLRHFASLISARTIVRIEIRWLDPQTEVRYGEIKQNASAVPLVHDVYPHLWSIIRVLIADSLVQPLAATRSDQGVVSLIGMVGGCQISAHAGRRNHGRERRVIVGFADGGHAELDFTKEPGVIQLDGMNAPQDPKWGITPTPVMEEVRQFISLLSDRSAAKTWPHLASRCIDSVTGAERFAAMLFASSARQIVQRAKDATVTPETHDLAWDIVVNAAVKSSADLAAISHAERARLAEELVASIARQASELRDDPGPELAQQMRKIVDDVVATYTDARPETYGTRA